MGDPMTKHGATTGPASGRATNAVLWVLQVLVAVAFAGAAIQKLGGTEYMVSIFAKIGFGAWFRYVIGVVEIIGAVGLVVPVLSGAASVGLALLMVGASVTDAAIGENLAFPLAFLVLTLPIVWGRWSGFLALFRALRKLTGHRDERPTS